MEFAQKMLSTRGGTIAFSAAAALLAAIILLAYLNQYRSSVNEATAPVNVLVAKSLIEKGTPGNTIGARELFQPTETPKNEALEGAVADPSSLRGRVAVNDIFPGQQLTLADFSGSTTNALGTKLVAKQRAISVPLTSSHGLIGQLEEGDRVDVFASLDIENGGRGQSVLKVIAQDIAVLDVPSSTATATAGGTDTTNVVLRTTRDQAAEIAFATDNGKIWLVLRPRSTTQRPRPAIVTQETLVAGMSPTRAYSNVRRILRPGGRR
jgi:Flp pilus assembly protein CpaB